MPAITSLIKDILFPRYCFGCSKIGIYICLSCQQRLQTLYFDICPYCRKRSYFGLTHPACKKKHGIDGLKSVYRYNAVVKKIILQIKYRLVIDAIDEFMTTIPHDKKEELLFFRQLSHEFIFIPVPLHEKRLKQRGFNQSYEMARFFSRILAFPVADDLITRQKHTKPQVAFEKPKERYLNIVGAFGRSEHVSADEIRNKQFIIFDDVWTTGWTIREVAKILKTHGASRVFALTMAR